MPVLDLTIEQVISLVQQLPPEGKRKVLELLQSDQTLAQHPWLKFAGKYQNDAQFEEMLAYIDEERREIDDRAENS